jgi:release factor glutamine methyltransferase
VSDGTVPSDPLNVEGALALARRRGIGRLDAQWLLAHLMQQERTWLLAHGDVPIDPAAVLKFEQGVVRRLAGEPLAYLVGEKEFYGLRLQVDSRVLVPRPETEMLVDWALELLRARHACAVPPKVVDLGTGSGAIALAIQQAHPIARVFASDASEDTLSVANSNALALGLPVTVAQGSWWLAFAAQRFHLALSNPPYIAADDGHLPALHSEPLSALTPGPSGLEALREIISGAPDHLEPGGWLLLEHGFDQAAAVRDLLARYGFRGLQTRTDLAGHPRCTGAKL